MKRNKLIEILIKEGFSEKTLVSLSDKQIKMLSTRILKENETLTVKQDDLKKIKPENLVNKTVRIVPESEIAECGSKSFVKEEGCLDECGETKKEIKEKSHKKVTPKNESIEKSQILNWVENLVESKYYSVTTKNEIMELIQRKLNEQSVAEPEIETPVKEPRTRPSEPTKEPGKRPFKEPWKKPGPGPDPRPKMEKNIELPEFLFFSNIVKLTKND